MSEDKKGEPNITTPPTFTNKPLGNAIQRVDDFQTIVKAQDDLTALKVGVESIRISTFAGKSKDDSYTGKTAPLDKSKSSPSQQKGRGNL